jgi:hypothetical protein
MMIIRMMPTAMAVYFSHSGWFSTLRPQLLCGPLMFAFFAGSEAGYDDSHTLGRVISLSLSSSGILAQWTR